MKLKKLTIVFIVLVILLTLFPLVLAYGIKHLSILHILFALIGTAPLVAVLLFTILGVAYLVWHELRPAPRKDLTEKK